MKIPCAVVRDLLPLYAENMIEEETHALVDEHLEECPECSKKLEEIKAEAAAPAAPAVDTAKPLLSLKKMINKRRWMSPQEETLKRGPAVPSRSMRTSRKKRCWPFSLTTRSTGSIQSRK